MLQKVVRYAHAGCRPLYAGHRAKSLTRQDADIYVYCGRLLRGNFSSPSSSGIVPFSPPPETPIVGANAMAKAAPYNISNEPPLAEQFYEQYRFRINNELQQKQKNRIIDVEANQVDLENASNASRKSRALRTQSTKRPTPANNTNTDQQIANSQYTKRSAIGKETEISNQTLRYQPDGSAGTINLELSPTERGKLIDFIA